MVTRFLPSLLLALGLTSCGSLPILTQEKTAVVYALGDRGGFPSPIASGLTPACPALTFTGDSHVTSGRHHLRLQQVAENAKRDKQRLLIAGYTSPSLPPDYARALSERRAQDVRQRLIERGVDAGSMHTLGLGNDFSPTGPSSDVVVIYHTAPANTNTNTNTNITAATAAAAATPPNP